MERLNQRWVSHLIEPFLGHWGNPVGTASHIAGTALRALAVDVALCALPHGSLAARPQQWRQRAVLP